MRILGVDTATSTASVALIEDGRLVAEEVHSSRGSANQSQTVNSRANHAEIILPLIEAALRKAAASCIFVGDGSTSYEKLLMDRLGNRAALWRADDSYPSLASAVARLSETRFQETQEVNLGSLVPVYLRSSEAEFRIKNLT